MVKIPRLLHVFKLYLYEILPKYASINKPKIDSKLSRFQIKTFKKLNFAKKRFNKINSNPFTTLKSKFSYFNNKKKWIKLFISFHNRIQQYHLNNLPFRKSPFFRIYTIYKHDLAIFRHIELPNIWLQFLSYRFFFFWYLYKNILLYLYRKKKCRLKKYDNKIVKSCCFMWAFLL